MKVRSLALQHFRNYSMQTFAFDESTTIIVGPNAAGKTAIIEAIHALATGNSFRAETTEEMISFNQELGRIKGLIERDDETIELELILTKGMVQGRKTNKRLYSINGTRRTKRKFTGNLLTVVFRPEDMRLVEGSPGRRRSFLDDPLQLIDVEYERALSTYNKALVRRNRLLTQVREGEVPRSVLTFWTLAILKHGHVLQEQRRQLCEFFRTVEFPVAFEIEYQPSVISEERLATYAEREIAAGHTLIGPHKDDFIVMLNQNNVSIYGSRGQQRMAVLWLKRCEQTFVKERTHQLPVLLLDDVLSELDESHRDLVFEQLGKSQVLLSTTDHQIVDMIKQLHPQAAVIDLSAGTT